jgi:hypothetical protein
MARVFRLDAEFHVETLAAQFYLNREYQRFSEKLFLEGFAKGDAPSFSSSFNGKLAHISFLKNSPINWGADAFKDRSARNFDRKKLKNYLGYLEIRANLEKEIMGNGLLIAPVLIRLSIEENEYNSLKSMLLSPKKKVAASIEFSSYNTDNDECRYLDDLLNSETIFYPITLIDMQVA